MPVYIFLKVNINLESVSSFGYIRLLLSGLQTTVKDHTDGFVCFSPLTYFYIRVQEGML